MSAEQVSSVSSFSFHYPPFFPNTSSIFSHFPSVPFLPDTNDNCERISPRNLAEDTNSAANSAVPREPEGKQHDMFVVVVRDSLTYLRGSGP